MLVDKPVDNLVDSTDMKQLPPISFRLTALELELLNNHKEDHESINQCAARLLRERLGIPDVNSNSTGLEPILEIMINEIISVRIDPLEKAVYTKVDSIVDKIESRLTAIEQQVNKPTPKRSYTKRKSEETNE